ncbi:unnamed protein product [Callosobruchus maculatus]|uniref:UDP-glucuronosyltransferase n=1 Tax=Callosobruchus maculatus TaxID=64391 RepID=A0A653DFH7_CALMS|nr:unnamed protein product [Callosobruchus maculatus]
MYQLLVSILLFHDAYAASILAISPSASFSHQVAFQPLWRELSLRGHQVTVMTTDPQKNDSLTNLTEIDMSYSYEILKKYDMVSVLSDDRTGLREKGKMVLRMSREVQDAQLSSDAVQKLLHGNMNFDLVIVEAQLPGMMAFAWRFKCPLIGIASMDAAMQFHDTMGNPCHPVITPDPNVRVEDYQHITFKERLISFFFALAYKLLIYNKTYREEHELLKKYFGEDLPPIWNIQRNMSMLFVNAHPLFSPMRPLNPNTIIVSGLHIGKPKPLPKELADFLDKAKQGFIYFSLGSNIRADIYNRTMNIDAILEAMAEVPYKVLWKLDMEFAKTPNNVKVVKWLPQQDVLRHPNIKLFITQGGMQSLQEAIINKVPILGIPMFGDQFNNVNMMVKRGCGIKLDRSLIDKQTFKKAVIEAIEEPRYRQKAQEMGEMFEDEPTLSLQRAVYWTEYVIKHKGAPHLTSNVPYMPFWMYYMLDVIVSALTAIVIVAAVLYLVLSRIISFILCKCFRNYLYKAKPD